MYALLCGHPVRSHKSRTVFLDREHLGAAGSLPRRLLDALEDSRFLVVLASRSAAESKWVDQEIRHFVACHGCERVLLCRVGDTDDEALPAAYVESYPDDKTRPHLPDLRGVWDAPGRALTRRRRERAMSVLAPVLGLASPSPLLATLRSRRRWWVGAFLSSAVLVTSWVAARLTWQTTVWHAQQRSERALLDDAKKQYVDAPVVLDGIHAFASLRRSEEAERLLQFYPPSTLHALAEAMLKAEGADCASAVSTVKRGPQSYLRSYMLAPMVIGVRCDAPEIVLATSTEEQWPLYQIEWTRALVRAGGFEAAWEAGLTAPVEKQWPLLATAALAAGDPERFASVKIPGTCSDYDTAMTLAGLAGAADAAGLVDSDAGGALAMQALQCLQSVDLDSGYAWNELARTAAALAAAGLSQDARTSVERLDEAHRSGAREGPGFVVGWALHGLALARLGDASAAEGSFRRAREQLLAPIEASRSWGEAVELVDVLVVAGRWQDAFELAELVPDIRGRTAVRIRLVELWHRRGPGQTRMARWTPSFDWFFGLS